ncbi:DUF6414 family protein [Kocuria rhizophila]
MFLREYIYVDVDKVAGLAAQLYSGVPEKAQSIVEKQRRVDVNFKVAGGQRGKATQENVERSLADALFHDLESDLEAEGVLNDISAIMQNELGADECPELVHPGMIVRITAPGTIFHSAQLSDALVKIATAGQGLAGLLEPEQPPTPAVPPNAKSAQQKKQQRNLRLPKSEPQYPEDYLPESEYVPYAGVSRAQLEGMIRLVRSLFGEGAHLNLRPAGPDGPVVTARLEGGRRFLDSSPEVLMSRYGIAEQQWTLVGIVGQLSVEGAVEGVDIMDGTKINRAKFVDLIQAFFAEANGFVDIPTSGGFSVVPLAVYRGIGYVAEKGPAS